MKKILIVNANYYKKISKNLVHNAKKILKKEKVKLNIVSAPGIFEAPVIVKKNIKKYDGFLVLGCVIKGKTPHFDLICYSSFNALMSLSVKFSKPVSNGIITALNMKQALERSSTSTKSKKPNKGTEAAKAVISILKNEPSVF